MATITTTISAEFRDAVAASSTDDLLTQAYHLTHRMDRSSVMGPTFREHRDYITAEVLRRTGDL